MMTAIGANGLEFPVPVRYPRHQRRQIAFRRGVTTYVARHRKGTARGIDEAEVVFRAFYTQSWPWSYFYQGWEYAQAIERESAKTVTVG